MIFEQFYPASEVSLTVAGPAMAPFFASGAVPLAIANNDSAVEIAALSMALPRFGPGVFIAGVPLDGPTDAGAGSGLQPFEDEVLAKGTLTLARADNEVRLQTGALAEVGAMLDICTRRIAQSWGLDLARLSNGSNAPQWVNRDKLLGRVNRTFGYSWQRRRHPQGVAYLRVIVSEAGTAEECSVVFVTAERQPNISACQIMQQARFEPARDANGQPLRSHFTTAFLDYRHPQDHLQGHSWGDPLFAIR